jgi:hypothetical protein
MVERLPDVSLIGMPLLRICWTAAFLLVMSKVHPLPAQEISPLGDSRQGLVGINRVPLVASTEPRLSAALDAGYALTESQRGEGVHHRILGSYGAGFVPLRGLEFSLLGGIRHDRHPNDGSGVDSGTVGDLAIVSRLGTRLGRALRLGADLSARFPGSEKPLDSLASPAIDARALFGWAAETGPRYAGFAGFRLDRTAGVAGSALRYRTGDRLALGSSDFNAVLVGIGVGVPLGRFELIGEVTGDLLVGTGAPPLSKSPIRVDLGLRHALSRVLQAELLSEVALSARPDTTPGSRLIPVQPRFGITFGLRYRLWNSADRTTPRAVPEPKSTRLIKQSGPPAGALPAPAEPPVAPPPATGRVVVTVVDAAGHALSDAVVELTTDAGVSKLDFEGLSTFALDAVPVGRGRLTVRADLMQDWEGEVEIVADHPLELRVEMVGAEKSGQIRGLVRAFNGKKLPAHVHIEPGGRDVQAGTDGAFSLEMPPGEYQVKVWLDGYQPQQRSVKVGKNAVMVLNVDLQKGR